MSPDVDDLVTAVTIVGRLGYRHHALVYQWRLRYRSFPEPVVRLGQVYVWVWPEVEAWAQATKRLPRNPGRGDGVIAP
jgi:predicted DNA-binding transcriptional regulator AlpA